jgi:hypothetical protein
MYSFDLAYERVVPLAASYPIYDTCCQSIMGYLDAHLSLDFVHDDNLHYL